jgi:ribosomal protein L30E
MTVDVELKRAFKTGKLEIGIKDAEKSVLFGDAKAIVMVASARDTDKVRLKHFCTLSKIPFVLVNHIPLELGKVIGLSYPVSAVSVIDEGKSKVLAELA